MPMLLLFASDFSKLLIGGLERGERRDARRREGDKVRENATDPKLKCPRSVLSYSSDREEFAQFSGSTQFFKFKPSSRTDTKS